MFGVALSIEHRQEMEKTLCIAGLTFNQAAFAERLAVSPKSLVILRLSHREH
jgi:hypothetical protein